eukprot:TRINITY_DN32974_c0_g1_i1.p1 TRINITY_DN32974_c0_g1~~TRINITY_DN32974_c0_g1_i1.p1  ORF type:complete len:181 (+),score=25.27 TRINITY_DN32974_c0_g1_i1:2-544(+)
MIKQFIFTLLLAFVFTQNKVVDDNVVLKFIGTTKINGNTTTASLKAGTEEIVSVVGGREGLETFVGHSIGGAATLEATYTKSGSSVTGGGTVSVGVHNSKPDVFAYTLDGFKSFGTYPGNEWSSVELGTITGKGGLYANVTGAYTMECDSFIDPQDKLYNIECWATFRLCFPQLIGKCKF